MKKDKKRKAKIDQKQICTADIWDKETESGGRAQAGSRTWCVCVCVNYRKKKGLKENGEASQVGCLGFV